MVALGVYRADKSWPELADVMGCYLSLRVAVNAWLTLALWSEDSFLRVDAEYEP